MRQAIQAKDPVLLRAKLEAYRGEMLDRLSEEPGFWLALLEDRVAPRLNSASEPARARSLFAAAKAAAEHNDLATVRKLVRDIFELLPDEDKADNPFRAHII
ncbi:MAG: hypothetical protein NZ899_14180 [Thermoguttaceae bacterium]|nr:hypothetical protein [Thermoguttaceae bacterium]MDW8079278.1 hypothetical protein [Thermoguttaceae bacterium]